MTWYAVNPVTNSREFKVGPYVLAVTCLLFQLGNFVQAEEVYGYNGAGGLDGIFNLLEDKGCTAAFCHDDQTSRSFETYNDATATTTASNSVVTPSRTTRPEEMVRRLNSTDTAFCMPLGNCDPAANADLIAAIQNWIDNDLKVTRPNTVPTINSVTNQSATEDDLLEFDVTLTDDDGTLSDNLTFSIESPNPPPLQGMSFLQTGALSGRFSWTPTSEEQGDVTVTLKVEDADADASKPSFNTATATFDIDVTLVLESPKFEDTPNITPPATAVVIEQNKPYNFTFTASDPEDDEAGLPLSFSIFSTDPDVTTVPPLEHRLSITSDGQLTWTSDGTVSSTRVTVRVTDSDARSSDFPFDINVTTGANDPPTFDNLPVSGPPPTVAENQTLNYDVNATDLDGDRLSFSLIDPPAGMVIDEDTGMITWTPDEARPGETPVTVEVSVIDCLDTGTPAGGCSNISSSAVTEDFAVKLLGVNDQPVLSPFANSVVQETKPLQINAGDNLTDPDDPNDGSGEITWSLSGAPNGMTISNLGVINWTPGQNSDGDYTVTVQVQDGLEDGSAPQIQPLTIAVEVLDTDNDGSRDYEDNCPNNPNPEQSDFDGDGTGDECDTDNDDDGISDEAEKANGLNPFDAADAEQDRDGDGLSNLEEFNNCVSLGDAECRDILTDSVAPVITLNNNVAIPAKGYVTAIGAAEAGVTAEDALDGPVKATPDNAGPFRPGRYTINWTATDLADNTATNEQQVDILPLVTLAGAQISGEGHPVSIPITMNGIAATYPVTIDYSVGGTADASDHDLAAGSVAIENGSGPAILTVNIVADGNPEADEQITITLTGVSSNAALSENVEHTVVIAERNLEPAVSLEVLQAGATGPYIYSDQGTVTVTANATDPNGDNLSFDWSSSDPQLNGTAANNQFTFDPAQLAPGSHQITVLVSDGITQVRHTATLISSAEAPALGASDTDGDGLDDGAEGRSDTDGDGLPDYLDTVDDNTLLQTSVAADSDDAADPDRLIRSFGRLIRSDAGVRLAMGSLALEAQRAGARISSLDVRDASGNHVADTEFSIVGSAYDFEIHGLSEAQRSTRVVIPLEQTIPPNAEYRKFSQGAWYTFIEDATDKLRSANSTDGICPPPGAADYQDGLIAFSDCVELTLTDGGPNDADGEANGVIKDPGGVATPASAPATTSSDLNSSPGGAGALGWWWLAMLAPLFLLQRRFR